MAIKVGGTTVIDDSRNITAISISGLTTALTLAQGGTGGTSAETARTSLGLVIGTNVLAPNGSAASLTSFPTLNQNTTGTAAGLSATLAIASGGTGTTSAQGAMNAFAAAVTSGSYLRGNGTNVVMSTIQAGDVPTLNQNTTGSAATFTSTSQNSQFNSVGVGTAASSTAGEIRATNNVTAYYSSDKRFKENVQVIPDALEKVNHIGGKLFDWTDDYIASHGGADGYFVQKADFGVIAQDVQKVFPIAVRTRDDGSLAVDYEKLSALAFAALVELTKRVEVLENN
jgi:hypothetical protein